MYKSLLPSPHKICLRNFLHFEKNQIIAFSMFPFMKSNWLNKHQLLISTSTFYFEMILIINEFMGSNICLNASKNKSVWLETPNLKNKN